MIHKTQIQKARSRQLWRLVSLICLGSSLAVLPACNFNSPAKPFSSEVNPTDSVAKVTEVKSRPVWIRFLNADSEQSATVGTSVKPGEVIRTEEAARVQIHLLSGDLVRVEGESSLKIAKKDTVNLDKGQLLAWSAPDRSSPTQIETPFGIVSLKNTTVFIDIPKDAAKDRVILALQGNVEVKLNSGSVPINLKQGQELTIKSDGTVSKPKDLDVAAVEKKFAKSRLIYGFDSRLESLAAIESRYTISSNTTETDKVPYSRKKKTAPAPANNPPQASNTPQETAPEPYRPPARYEAPRRDPEPPPQTTTRRSDPEPQADPLAVPRRAEPAAPQAAEPPPQPVQPEVAPAPLEPPPLPVQPEAPPPQAAPTPAPEEPRTP
ncbi:FecR domain-containing protein [Pseudanabaena sp. PCC 6802]|uniref:FecR domain-containing protein n=1 Tax=Pseudanabaena sp. PCC 6802 TaxID=118173 RepID=UPI00034B3F9C|nr:FecR domain-containing protein [Pseudanabaena sp. PCC 6802]